MQFYLRFMKLRIHVRVVVINSKHLPAVRPSVGSTMKQRIDIIAWDDMVCTTVESFSLLVVGRQSRRNIYLQT